MQHTFKKITKTLTCLLLLVLIQGFTPQTPVQDKKVVIAPEQEKTLALRKKLALASRKQKAEAQPTQSEKIANLPILVGKLKARLQGFSTQTLTVYQKHLGKSKLVDTYQFTNGKQITATSAKSPKQKWVVSAELTQLLQSFLVDASLLGRMLEIKTLPVAVADKNKVTQRLQIKPKSEFKKLLGFSNGNANFDANGNLLRVELWTAKNGIQIYDLAKSTPVDTQRINK